jgi:hypothetical protein
MSGVKGRSGRRPLSIELKRLAIIDKAWARCEAAIDDPNNKMGDTIAKDIATKDQTLKVDAEVKGEIIMMPVIEKNGKPLEYGIGENIDAV